MAKVDPEREAHKAWLGLVQPVGLVVSPPALVKAQVVPDKNVIPSQQALLGVVARPVSVYADGEADPVLLDFPRFAVEVLGWSLADLAGAPGGPPLSDALALPLPDYGETLRPTHAVLDGIGEGKTLLMVQVVDRGLDLDKPPPEDTRTAWPASPHARLERLLGHTNVPAGLLLNGVELRLVYAPRGESSGHMGFPIAEMCTVGGRPLLAALHMLLCEHRVFGAPDKQRLLDLLAESRKYQNEVSNRLAEQVLSALWELLRGFQAADEAAAWRVLHDLPRTDPQEIYGGLLTVIMRLVFLLYAEDQGLISDDPVYARNYAIGGLFERLREDAGRYPDMMDQRFGAYAWLLATFRMVFDGGAHGALQLPTRHGQLFNPDEYPFLEGRPPGVGRVMGETFEAPRVSDGVIWRVLNGLLVLDGERLSYRALDVEQVGSVYEAMMGFDVRTLPGRALAVRPKNVVFDVDALLAVPGVKRAAWLKEQTECDLAAGSAQSLRDATTAEDVVAALGRRVAPQTPRALAPGALFLQPGEERRRSGSHYTPRELTEPIVRTTLRPVLEALGPKPTPEQILDLKVCDPAMGSGAFLVEACRQLGVALEDAWRVHGATPKLPPDETALLHARRLVAQRCLYGVDKNRFAVNLAKLSLWLVTLAKDHAFTFLDHALKHGDSLVGLTKAQLGAFHWNPPLVDSGPLFAGIAHSVEEVTGWRRQIQALGEGDYDQRRMAWKEAEDVVHDVRLIGDLCIAAFFGAEKDKDREALRREYRAKVDGWKAGGDRSEIDFIVGELRGGEKPVPPLHWEIEFPEVFGRGNPGFDAIVGNPPFAGSVNLARSFGERYSAYLRALFTGAGGKTDLVAFFFLRSFRSLRGSGAMGLLATNTISQGDTRESGLAAIARENGEIFSATRRKKWPGGAAVTVSILHIRRFERHRKRSLPAILDGVPVARISTYLLTNEQDESPAKLNQPFQAFLGSKPGAKGFVFSDQGDPYGSMNDFVLLNSIGANASILRGFLIGDDILNVVPPGPSRWVVDLTDYDLDEARRRFPAVVNHLDVRVRPFVSHKNWWQFARRALELRAILASRDGEDFLAISEVSQRFALAFFPGRKVLPSNRVVVFPTASRAAFGIVQSSVHELWVRAFSSSFEDRVSYVPADCFDTFPFSSDWGSDAALESASRVFYDFRGALIIEHNEGLAKTYNRFHDPDERDSDIFRLRELHAAMDRAVLAAYGWTDIPTDCDFFLDYEIDEETWGDKKKPYRYRWPDVIRDKVLARLLDLNQKRYQEEVAAGLHGKLDAATPSGGTKARSPRKSPKAPAKRKRPLPNPTLGLFDRKKEDGQ